jgi:hypothetical protein
MGKEGMKTHSVEIKASLWKANSPRRPIDKETA